MLRFWGVGLTESSVVCDVFIRSGWLYTYSSLLKISLLRHVTGVIYHTCDIIDTFLCVVFHTLACDMRHARVTRLVSLWHGCMLDAQVWKMFNEI